MRFSALNEVARRRIPRVRNEAERLKFVAHVRELVVGDSACSWATSVPDVPVQLRCMVLLDEDGPLEEGCTHVKAIETLEWGRHEFGHHSAPCNDVSLEACPRLLLVMHDRSEEAI